jgi:hypothetical protein
MRAIALAAALTSAAVVDAAYAQNPSGTNAAPKNFSHSRPARNMPMKDMPQDKYALKVPGGLAFAEFRGYEDWPVVSVSQAGPVMSAILANPVMMQAFRAGIPANGKPVPDGARMAKVHWNTTKMKAFPTATVPETQHDVDFMVKDSKRFADSGGWGYAVFVYEAKANRFRPGTTADMPPQANDAKCGFACHSLVKAQDYVFTEYHTR